MKNKSIGRLILVALLAPSCGGGGGGGGGKGSITPPRWAETYRTPTSVDLRVVRFGNPLAGIAAGRFGTFVRTDNGGDTWYSLESTPVSNPNFDILSMAVSQTTTFAVGGSPAGGFPAGSDTYTGSPSSLSAAWQSLDATTFLQADNPPVFNSEPWVDLILTGAATHTLAASTLRLRSDGKLDLCQGSILSTKDSTIGDGTATPPAPAAPWTRAMGMSVASSTNWFVCGNNGGFGQIRYTLNADLQTGTFWYTATLPSATGPVLRRIALLSSTQGYAVGDSGTILTLDPTVLPPGSAWKHLPGTNPITANLRSMHFLDADNGWVAGDLGTIYRIRNASTATPIYEAMSTGTSENLYDIYFVDANNGYAVGNNGIVLKTSNGASTPTLPTWTIKSGPAVNPAPTFNAVDFSASASVGLAVGSGGTLVRSLDSGTTWSPFNIGPGATALTLNLTAVSIPRHGTNTVAFVGTDTGAVYFNTGILGSGTWQLATGGPFGAAIKAILFPKGDTAGLVCGATGAFAHLDYTPAVVAPPTAASATLTMQTLPSSPGGTLFALACDPTGNSLYVGGDAGYLEKSTDAGVSWSAVTGAGKPTGSIRALQAPTGPSFTLFAGVDDDQVHSMTPGGTWAAVSIPNFGTPAGMAFIDDLTGWVVTQGANGGIRFTFDGGVSWSASGAHVPIDASAAHTLNAIWMHPSQLGIIVGGNGVIIQTTTGGR